MSNQFKKAFKGIDSAIKTGTSRALNRALSSTKTQVIRALKADTGLKTEVVTKRTYFQKATTKNLAVEFNILTKRGIPLRQFSPKEKTVKVEHRGSTKVNSRGKRINSTKKRTHYGVSVKIGKQPRELAPGAFIMRKHGSAFVVGRKGAYSKGRYLRNNADRLPTTELKTDAFIESAKTNRAMAEKTMKTTFDKNVKGLIDYSIQQKFKTNK